MNIINKEEKFLFSGLSISMAAHAALLSLFFIKSVFFKVDEIDYTAAIRVELIGLPEKESFESAAPIASPTLTASAPETTQKVEAEVSQSPPVKLTPKEKNLSKRALEKEKKAQDAALAKIKTQMALDQIRSDIAKEHIQKLSKNSETKPNKGNLLSEGSALSGIKKLEFNEYAVALDQHIKKNWLLPEWLNGKNFQAQVRVFVSKNGALLGKNLISSSGNNEYDQAALNTIESSSPFPPPPSLISETLENRGFVVFFP